MRGSSGLDREGGSSSRWVWDGVRVWCGEERGRVPIKREEKKENGREIR